MSKNTRTVGDRQAPLEPTAPMPGARREETAGLSPAGGFSSATAPGEDTGVVIEMPRPKLIALFAGLLIAMLVASLDQTIVSTALPTIVGELNGADHILWVTTAYVLAATITMPVYGKLGDLIGRKGLFIGGLLLLAAGSAACGLATSMPALIAGRAVQGLGGGGLMILAQAIIADVVPARVRGAYMGVMGVAFAVPMVLGPLLGGYFTDVVGWRWAFWINLPLVALSVVAAIAWLPRRPVRGQMGRLDTWGMVTMTISLTSLVLVTSLGGTTLAWGSPAIIGLVVACIVFGVLFVLAEHRAVEPLIPLYLFRSRNFVLTTTAGLVSMLGLMGAVSYLPTYFQIVHGLSATASGFMEMPALIAEGVASVAAGVAVSRMGRYKAMMVASFAVAALGMGCLATLGVDTSLVLIGCYLFVLGLGVGLNIEILVLIAQNEFPTSVVGTVTAANNFFREVGTTLGASLVGALFTANLARTMGEALAGLGGVAGATGAAEGAAGALTAGVATGSGTAVEAVGVSVSSITPELVRELPGELADAIAAAYSDALAPVFVVVVPLMIVGLVLMTMLRNTRLANHV